MFLLIYIYIYIFFFFIFVKRIAKILTAAVCVLGGGGPSEKTKKKSAVQTALISFACYFPRDYFHEAVYSGHLHQGRVLLGNLHGRISRVHFPRHNCAGADTGSPDPPPPLAESYNGNYLKTVSFWETAAPRPTANMGWTPPPPFGKPGWWTSPFSKFLRPPRFTNTC